MDGDCPIWVWLVVVVGVLIFAGILTVLAIGLSRGGWGGKKHSHGHNHHKYPMGPGPVVTGPTTGGNGASGAGSASGMAVSGTSVGGNAGSHTGASILHAGQVKGYDPSKLPVAADYSGGSDQPSPLGFFPYSHNVAAAYDRRYPESEQPQSLTKVNSMDPSGLQGVAAADMSGYEAMHHPSGYDKATVCGVRAADQCGGYLDADKLMPESWRGGVSGCPSSATQGPSQNWAKFAPTKEAFNQYITAAGSARLGVNTRVKAPGGVRSLLRGGPTVPLSSTQVTFNDSGFRNDLVYNSTGFYPDTAHC